MYQCLERSSHALRSDFQQKLLSSLLNYGDEFVRDFHPTSLFIGTDSKMSFRHLKFLIKFSTIRHCITANRFCQEKFFLFSVFIILRQEFYRQASYQYCSAPRLQAYCTAFPCKPFGRFFRRYRGFLFV